MFYIFSLFMFLCFSCADVLEQWLNVGLVIVKQDQVHHTEGRTGCLWPACSQQRLQAHSAFGQQPSCKGAGSSAGETFLFACPTRTACHETLPWLQCQWREDKAGTAPRKLLAVHLSHHMGWLSFCNTHLQSGHPEAGVHSGQQAVPSVLPWASTWIAGLLQWMLRFRQRQSCFSSDAQVQSQDGCCPAVARSPVWQAQTCRCHQSQDCEFPLATCLEVMIHSIHVYNIINIINIYIYIIYNY